MKVASFTAPLTMNAPRKLEDMNFVRLQDALLCANCEAIVSEMRNGKCPVCESGALMSVARMFGGTLEHPQPRPIDLDQAHVAHGEMRVLQMSA